MSRYSNRKMCYWYNFLKNVINDFDKKGYNFNHIAKMSIITVSNKMVMSNYFYIKHIICALEWNLNAMINKNE